MIVLFVRTHRAKVLGLFEYFLRVLCTCLTVALCQAVFVAALASMSLLLSTEAFWCGLGNVVPSPPSKVGIKRGTKELFSDQN